MLLAVKETIVVSRQSGLKLLELETSCVRVIERRKRRERRRKRKKIRRRKERWRRKRTFWVHALEVSFLNEHTVAWHFSLLPYFLPPSPVA